MLNHWYVTGLCDGEAAFTYSRASKSFALYFAIRQKQENKQIIENIREYFKYIGTIYYGKESKIGSKTGFSQPSVYYRVTKITELERIVEHFDKYPLQSEKKRQAYDAWREMVKYKLENFRDIDYSKLVVLAEKLSNLNSQSRAFKVHKT